MKLSLNQVRLPLASFALELNLEFGQGATVLFGPSGAGKTSLLDLIAGLRRPQSGVIQLNGRTLTDRGQGIEVPTRDRGIGYVPQDLALFPHLTVRQNLNYGNRQMGSVGKIGTLGFEQVVEVLELRSLLAGGVNELSGGEKQRVALARALLAAPKLLLLDEPLASLDGKLKSRVIPYLLRIRDEFRVPMIYVTHDRLEAIAMADEMVVMTRGQVVQQGGVEEVFSRPATLDAAGILAVESIQPGKLLEKNAGLLKVAVGEAVIFAMETEELQAAAREVFVCIRAEDVVLLKSAGPAGSPRNHLSATIKTIRREGWLMRVELDAGFRLTALVTTQAGEEMALKPGGTVLAMVKAQNVHLIQR